MCSQRTAFFRLDGRRIAHATVGTGPPLVLAAWWVSNIVEDWKEARFRGFIEALATGRQVIRYDRLGCGMSDRTRPRFRIEGFDPVGASVRHVYLRTQRGEHPTVQSPTA